MSVYISKGILVSMLINWCVCVCVHNKCLKKINTWRLSRLMVYEGSVQGQLHPLFWAWDEAEYGGRWYVMWSPQGSREEKGTGTSMKLFLKALLQMEPLTYGFLRDLSRYFQNVNAFLGLPWQMAKTGFLNTACICFLTVLEVWSPKLCYPFRF